MKISTITAVLLALSLMFPAMLYAQAQELVDVDQQAMLALDGSIRDQARAVQELSEKIKAGLDVQRTYDNLAVRQEELSHDFAGLKVLAGTDDEDLLLQCNEALRILAPLAAAPAA